MPYTYLIGWSKLNYWYYGCRYSKNANPDDLWKTYFTSSRYVKEMRIWHGEPDVIQIRRIFKTRNQALRCEEKVLRKLNAVKSPRWLNKGNAGKQFHSVISWNVGLHHDIQTIEKIRQAHIGRKHTHNLRHFKGSQTGGRTRANSGGLKKIAHLGGLAQGPKNGNQLRSFNVPRRKKVCVQGVVYDSQTAAGKVYNIAAATVRDRILSKNWPDWQYA